MRPLIIGLALILALPAFAEPQASKDTLKRQRDNLYQSVQKMMETCYQDESGHPAMNTQCQQAIEQLNAEMFGLGEDFYCNHC